MRRILFPAAAASLALVAVEPDSAASTSYRVEVTVVGQGAIRVRIAQGHVTPCESLENRPIFTEWLAPGPPRIFSITDDCICIEHTYGSFREAQWSLPTQYRYVPWRDHNERLIRVFLPTDTP